MFNKPSDWTFEDWRTSEAARLLSKAQYTFFKWICSNNMTDEEKELRPEYKTTGGYLKKLDEHEVAQEWWDKLPDSDRKIIESIPNFDPDIFEECTGIKINKN